MSLWRGALDRGQAAFHCLFSLLLSQLGLLIHDVHEIYHILHGGIFIYHIDIDFTEDSQDRGQMSSALKFPQRLKKELNY